LVGHIDDTQRREDVTDAAMRRRTTARRVVALGDDPGATPFVLTAIGLALTVAGPLLVSGRLAEPHYDVMLAWDPEEMPTDWEAERRRYFTLNGVRAAATWGAFAIFLAALVEPL
jgi:hypothetical protein